MKKRGFTLIELLAVIVVLAIIALIATPIVMNLISNAGKGAAERSGERYLKAVETMIASERAKDGTIVEDGTYTIGDGKISKDGKEYTIEVTGDYPKEGSIVIANGQVVSSGTSMVIGDYTVTVDAKGKATASEAPAVVTLDDICSVEPNYTALAVGAKYNCNLGDGDRYFYVLENNADSDNISLILEGNYDTTVQGWCSIVDGETCDLTEKLDDIRDAWDELGEEQITLPTAEQIYAAEGLTVDGFPNFPSSSLTLTKEWLYSYPNLVAPEWPLSGYWTATSTPDLDGFVWFVRFNGEFYVDTPSTNFYWGVRPVITVAK